MGSRQPADSVTWSTEWRGVCSDSRRHAKKWDGCASVREIHHRFVYVLQSVGLSNHYFHHVDPVVMKEEHAVG